jgi:hypothetical protein
VFPSPDGQHSMWYLVYLLSCSIFFSENSDDNLWLMPTHLCLAATNYIMLFESGTH